jgi:alpha-tubulin suppressor-like RCC1 family protein
LGHGDDAYRRLPTVIEGLIGHKVVQASCFGAHNAVLTDKGLVFMWGSGTVRLSLDLPVRDSNPGAMWCAVQQDGKLGQGDNESHFAPVLVRTLEGTGVKSIACGYDFTAALTVEGHLFTCTILRFSCKPIYEPVDVSLQRG